MESELREGSWLMAHMRIDESHPLWLHPLQSDFAVLLRRLGIWFPTLQQGLAWDTQNVPEWPCASPGLGPGGALHPLRALSPLCYRKDQSSLQRAGVMWRETKVPQSTASTNCQTRQRSHPSPTSPIEQTGDSSHASDSWMDQQKACPCWHPTDS